jgi:hypothetical protein
MMRKYILFSLLIGTIALSACDPGSSTVGAATTTTSSLWYTTSQFTEKKHLTDPPIITHSKVQFYFTNVGEWISDIMRYAIRDLVISRF